MLIVNYYVIIENIENIYCHSLSIQYSNLSTECIQNEISFLKDFTSKHVGDYATRQLYIINNLATDVNTPRQLFNCVIEI